MVRRKSWLRKMMSTALCLCLLLCLCPPVRGYEAAENPYDMQEEFPGSGTPSANEETPEEAAEETPGEAAEVAEATEAGEPVEPENFLAGSGTEASPFLIATVGQFVKMAQEYCPKSSPKTGIHFLQIADLDLGGLPESCYPVALGSNSVYDGGGFSICNTAYSLFVSNSGVIQNVHVENCNITSSRGGQYGSAGIVELNRGTIQNGSVSGMICGSSVGGIAGYNDDLSVIENCVNTADLQGSAYAGGIVHFNEKYYFKYYNSSTLYPKFAKVINCYNTGHVTVVGEDGTVSPGYGIASGHAGSSNISGNSGGDGYNADGIVENCYDNDTLARETDYKYRLVYSDTNLSNSYHLCGTVKADNRAVTEAEFQGANGVGKLDPESTGTWEVDTYNINGGLPVLAWENKLAARKQAGPCTVTPSVPSGGDPILEPFDLTLSGGREGTIWYTTDGSDPQNSDTRVQYQDSIPIQPGSTLLRVWSDQEGYSSILHYQVVKYPVTPTLSAGTYTGARTTQLSCADGGEIYYTTDGSDPRTSLTRLLYSDSSLINLNQSSVTVTAVALKDNVWGDPLAYTYSLIPDVTLTPEPGQYSKPTYVTLSTSLTDCSLYYSTDGSNPSSDGALYDSPILLLGPTDLKVSRWIGNNGYLPDTYRYELPKTTITPSPEPGAQDGAFQLSFSYKGLSGLQLYVSRDGGEYQLYTGPLDIYKSVDLSVQARYGGAVAAEQSFAYTVPAPTIIPAHPAGEYSNVFPLTLRHNGGDGFRLYVSRDNGEYQLYTGPLDIYKSVDLSVQARWQDDPVTTSSFRYTLPDLALTASPQGGTYTLPQEVTLSCNIPDYSIAYALDGGDPVPYTGPIPIQQSARLTAYAQYKGETVGEKTFDYTLNLPELTASPDGGTMARPTDVTLTCSQSGFQILYTLDGSDPREGGSTYSAPIHLDHPVQLWAVSVTTVDGERRYGAEKQWQYDFEDLFSVKDLAVSSRSDGFALTATLDNRYPDSREAFLLAAGYDAAGRLTETKIFPAVSAKDSTAELSGLFTPSKDLNSFRVFALERDSWQPLATPVLNARVFTGLSVSPSSVNGKQGTSQAVTVTARYSDGTSQSLNSGAYTASSSNSSVAYASGGYVYFGSGGSAVITFSYTDGGITKTAQVQAVSEAPTLTGITCSSSSLSGTVGGSQSLSVTAWYADGTSRSLNSGAYTVSSSNSSVAYASGGTIYYAGAGSATLTVSCTEGGVTRTTSVSVTVRESTAAASRRLVSFLLTQPDNRIQITAHASDGSVGVVTILYNTSSSYVHFQYDVVLIDGGGGFAGFDLNPATGSLVQQPVVGFMASNNSTLLWGGHTTNFNAATYYHDSTTLSFTRVTGTVATSTIQSMANTLIQTLVPGAQRMLTENNTGVTLGQLGFLRYA